MLGEAHLAADHEHLHPCLGRQAREVQLVRGIALEPFRPGRLRGHIEIEELDVGAPRAVTHIEHRLENDPSPAGVQSFNDIEHFLLIDRRRRPKVDFRRIYGVLIRHDRQHHMGGIEAIDHDLEGAGRLRRGPPIPLGIGAIGDGVDPPRAYLPIRDCLTGILRGIQGRSCAQRG